MRLQEPKTIEAARDEATGKRVQIFLRSSFYLLQGTWQWDLQSDDVFCSDVMMPPPPGFTGTRAIFHPDDVPLLHEALALDNGLSRLQFRIITSYGELKTLRGRDVVAEGAAGLPVTDGVHAALLEKAQKAAATEYELLKAIDGRCGALAGSGAWHYNAATAETWYADSVFLLHGLPPQSLNAHLNTFQPFVHPDDRAMVEEFRDRALQHRLPLHIDYRVVAGTREKWVGFKAHWFFGPAGEAIFGGVYQDLTEQKAAERELETCKNLVQFQRQQLMYDEQHLAFGHWQIDLLTRKATFSDQYYRLFGLKPQVQLKGPNGFLNYVHPNDRNRVEEAHRKLIHEHAFSDLEFRIIRADGKTRHLLQRARLVMNDGEMLVSGVVQDLTVQRQLEKKLAAVQDTLAVQSRLQQQGEEIAGLYSWVLDLEENDFAWSESLYKLLGYSKMQPRNITEKSLFGLVHPQDLKDFRAQWAAAVQHRQPSAFSVRLLYQGVVRYMKAVFEHAVQNEKPLFLGTLQDLTAAELMQQRLTQRVQLAESLTENIPDRVLITDANNTVIFWNTACEKTFGIKKSGAVGENIFDLLPALKTEELVQLFHRALRGEKVVQEARPSPVGTGYIDLYLLPMMQDDNVTGLLHVMHDATRETELRNRLADRLQLIESLVQSSVDRIVALDRNMNYLYWNKKAEEHYNLSREAVVGRNILDVFPQVVNDPSYGEFRRALRGETVHIPAAHGQKKHFETYLIPIKSENGEVTGLLWVTHDLKKEFNLLSSRQRAQKELEEEHRRLKEAQAIGHIGSFQWQAATDVIYWSDEMFRIHGLEPQSEVPTWDRVVGLIHPDDAPELAEKLQQCRREAGSAVFAHRIVRADGETRHVIRQVQTFADEKGRVTHQSGTLQDVTDRRKAEQLLAEQAHFLRRITETIPDMVSIMELPSRKLRFLNKATFAENGFEIEKMSRQSTEELAHLVHPDDRPYLDAYFTRLTAAPDDEVVTAQYRARTMSGEWRWFQVRGKVFLRDGNGTVMQILNAIENITALKAADQAARESRRLLEQTALASPDAITVYDLETRQPVYLNDCLAEWLGVPSDELVLMGHNERLQFVHPDDRGPLLQFNKAVAATTSRDVHTLEYRLRAKEGWRWVRNRSRVFQRNENGGATHLLSVLQDVTDEKAAEQKLQRLYDTLEAKNTELESKNEEITSFAFVASHDLKEPLRKIHTFSDWMQTHEPGLSQNGQQILTRLMASVKRLDALVDDILALTKVHVADDGTAPVDLNEVLKIAVDEMRDDVARTGARIQAPPLPSVTGVESQLVYLFKNILSNSLKFQPPGNTPVVSIQSATDDGRIRISFTDNGIGFSPEYRTKIFQMFRRLHGRTEYEGTGMGLAICRRIMQKHGGSINATSEPGKGATLTCFFPA